MIDSSTFASLFHDLHPKIYGYVRAQVASREIAEDITATAFERALKGNHTYNPQKGAVDSWLFGIVRNLIIDHHMARSKQPRHVELEAAFPLSTSQPSPEQAVLQAERQQVLELLLAELPDRDREIIHLRFFGKLTNRKIAELLEMNEKTVSVIIFRTLKKLKMRLNTEDQP